MIKDHKDSLSYRSYSKKTAAAITNEPQTSYSHVTATGNVITSYSYKPVSQEESIYNNNSIGTAASEAQDDVPNRENEKELTLTALLNSLQFDHSMVDSLLENLRAYCQQVRAANIDAEADRKKTFV